MSDNFDRKVCNELGWIAVNCQLLNLSTQLDNTNLGKHYQAMLNFVQSVV